MAKHCFTFAWLLLSHFVALVQSDCGCTISLVFSSPTFSVGAYAMGKDGSGPFVAATTNPLQIWNGEAVHFHGTNSGNFTVFDYQIDCTVPCWIQNITIQGVNWSNIGGITLYNGDKSNTLGEIVTSNDGSIFQSYSMDLTSISYETYHKQFRLVETNNICCWRYRSFIQMLTVPDPNATKLPTLHPSITPTTSIPTANVPISIQPTSVQPTTANPTRFPTTANPTRFPTTNPTILTLLPTNNPIIKSTNVRNIAVQKDNSKPVEINYIFYIILTLALILSVLILITVVYMMCSRRRIRKLKAKIMHQHDTDVHKKRNKHSERMPNIKNTPTIVANQSNDSFVIDASPISPNMSISPWPHNVLVNNNSCSNYMYSQLQLAQIPSQSAHTPQTPQTNTFEQNYAQMCSMMRQLSPHLAPASVTPLPTPVSMTVEQLNEEEYESDTESQSQSESQTDTSPSGTCDHDTTSPTGSNHDDSHDTQTNRKDSVRLSIISEKSMKNYKNEMDLSNETNAYEDTLSMLEIGPTQMNQHVTD